MKLLCRFGPKTKCELFSDGVIYDAWPLHPDSPLIEVQANGGVTRVVHLNEWEIVFSNYGEPRREEHRQEVGIFFTEVPSGS